MRRPTRLAGILLLVLLAPLPSAAQQQSDEDRAKQRLQIPQEMLRRAQPGNAFDAHQMANLRRRLVELDRLLALGSLGRAETLIADLEQHSGMERELKTRPIRLAQLKGRHAIAVDLCREALDTEAFNPGLWRELATSLLALARPDSARLALDRFMELNPNTRSAAIVSLDLLMDAAYPAAAVGRIDSMRVVLDEPRFLGRQRAAGLLGLDRQAEAAAEISTELRNNPYNYALVRTELLEGPYRPQDHTAFLADLRGRATEPGAKGGEALLVANLLLIAGDVPGAVELALPLHERANLVLVLLQNCQTLTREIRLTPDQPWVPHAVQYLLAVLEPLPQDPRQDAVVRRRAADYLADVCEAALDLDVLGTDPATSVARFGEVLDVVRRAHPASERLYSSQIRLAAYTRDRLHDPAGAARRLEGMLLDLDLPNEGLALVRLTLGECYLAAGDSTRGRVVLTRLGRDPRFREAGGHAHYHLARLDLAQGHLATARDRFAVIALDNPGAAYANDALDLGLILSEELDNPTGGPDMVALYGEAVYAELTARPDARVAALERYLAAAEQRLDLDEPQRLYERAAFELARTYGDHGRLDEALDLLGRLALEHPDGRYPAQALRLKGRLLEDAGRLSAARTAWEQLLAQYPDYLFIDDVRDELRALPN